jgi:hypothetical protein
MFFPSIKILCVRKLYGRAYEYPYYN